MIYKRFCNQVGSQISYILALGEAQGGLGGLKPDEIDAANSFLMLPMARNGFKRPVKTSQRSRNGLLISEKTNRRHESAQKQEANSARIVA